jgi:hypothetical protein
MWADVDLHVEYVVRGAFICCAPLPILPCLRRADRIGDTSASHHARRLAKRPFAWLSFPCHASVMPIRRMNARGRRQRCRLGCCRDQAGTERMLRPLARPGMSQVMRRTRTVAGPRVGG